MGGARRPRARRDHRRDERRVRRAAGAELRPGARNGGRTGPSPRGAARAPRTRAATRCRFRPRGRSRAGPAPGRQIVARRPSRLDGRRALAVRRQRSLALISMLDLTTRYRRARLVAGAGADVCDGDGGADRSIRGLRWLPSPRRSRDLAGRPDESAAPDVERSAAAPSARSPSVGVPRPTGADREDYFPIGGGVAVVTSRWRSAHGGCRRRALATSSSSTTGGAPSSRSQRGLVVWLTRTARRISTLDRVQRADGPQRAAPGCPVDRGVRPSRSSAEGAAGSRRAATRRTAPGVARRASTRGYSSPRRRSADGADGRPLHDARGRHRRRCGTLAKSDARRTSRRRACRRSGSSCYVSIPQRVDRSRSPPRRRAGGRDAERASASSSRAIPRRRCPITCGRPPRAGCRPGRCARPWQSRRGAAPGGIGRSLFAPCRVAAVRRADVARSASSPSLRRRLTTRAAR